SKALKRSGFFVFGYREYPSLIVGGHAGYQFDVSDSVVRSPTIELDAVLSLNYQGLTRYFDASTGSALDRSRSAASHLKEGGTLIHAVPDWKFSPEHEKKIAERKIHVVKLPIHDMLHELDAPLVLQNVIFAAFFWKMFGRELPLLQTVIAEQFAKKKHLIEINLKAAEKGYNFIPEGGAVTMTLPPPKDQWKDHLLITGNEAIGLGAIHCGVRFYAGYPMTPASSLLGYVAKAQNETGMIVKQAEDEITAGQIASGAYFMGTRAMTGTSGGGFDLMTETLSMDSMIESPMVFVLGQRPGPATGVPTWTAQGDLFLAVHAGHGEFPRCVMAIADAEDAFHLLADAHNIAEKYQIPVIFLTDKYIAECLFCPAPFETEKTTIDRGWLVTREEELMSLKAEDRYRITEDG
ncbi:MAG: 2-oxoacid:acceptor oxidoreductase family protein, partial [Patescibacteria group bacterium]